MIGRKIEVGVALEDVRGALQSPSYWVPKYDITLQDKAEYIDDVQTFGNIADSDTAELEKEFSEGELEGKIRLDSFPVFAIATLGDVSTSNEGDGAYEHTIGLLNSNTHPSMTVVVKDPLETKAFVNVMVESLKIKAEIGKYVEYTLALKGKKGTNTTGTPSYTEETEFRARHASLIVADDMAGLETESAVANIRSIEVSMDKNLEEILALGNSQPTDYQNLEFSCEVNIEAEYDDVDTFKAVHLSGAKKALRIAIEDTTKVVATSELTPRIVLDLAKVSFQTWERDGGAGDKVRQSIKAKAHFSLAEGKMLEMKVRNDVASY